MNKQNMQAIFRKYIENFEFLNNEKNNETYKWEIVQEFQKFDIEAVDFAEMLAYFCKTASNLTDSSQQLPFTALVEYAKKEPETVREMFRKLYAREELDAQTKQQVICEFIASSEELRKKYYPDSRLYVNNQRSVMMYLFLRYPNSNYGYKAVQAKSFADCIEFYDDWGPMTDFKLEPFNRMCDQLIEAIKADEALMQTHRSRYETTDRNLHPDEKLHILAMDIIFCSQTYHFYDGMTFEPINAQARKLYFERVAKAKELAETLAKAKEDMLRLSQAKHYVESSVTKGLPVTHKKYGEGVVEDCVGMTVFVHFPSVGETKKLGLAVSVSNGLLRLPSEEITQKIKENTPLLMKEPTISAALLQAEEAIQPYVEYLD